jgi:hypothetical protein
MTGAGRSAAPTAPAGDGLRLAADGAAHYLFTRDMGNRSRPSALAAAGLEREDSWHAAVPGRVRDCAPQWPASGRETGPQKAR